MTEFTNLQRLPASDLNNNLPPIGALMPYGGSSAPNAEWLLCDGSAISRATYATLFTRLSTSFGAGDGSTTFNIPDMRGRGVLGVGANSWTTTFLFSAVDIGTDIITVPSNNALYSGTKVRLTTSGTLPTGLSLATDYYVIRLSATTIQLATSRQNAIGGNGQGTTGTITAINITAQGSGTNTITVQDLSTRTMGERGGEETHPLTIAELPAHSKHAERNASPVDLESGSSDSLTNISTGGDTPHNNMHPYVALNWIIKAK
jgi:microcystin-dependent protein